MWGPGTFSYLHEKKIKFHKAKLSSLQGEAGHVLEINKESFIVGCKEGSLEIIELQPESKPKMKSEDFLRGYSLTVGDAFL